MPPRRSGPARTNLHTIPENDGPVFLDHGIVDQVQRQQTNIENSFQQLGLGFCVDCDVGASILRIRDSAVALLHENRQYHQFWRMTFTELTIGAEPEPRRSRLSARALVDHFRSPQSAGELNWTCGIAFTMIPTDSMGIDLNPHRPTSRDAAIRGSVPSFRGVELDRSQARRSASSSTIESWQEKWTKQEDGRFNVQWKVARSTGLFEIESLHYDQATLQGLGSRLAWSTGSVQVIWGTQGLSS